MVQPLDLSQPEARRLALGGHRLGGGGDLGTPLEVLRLLGAIQLDAIQRVDKAHRLVCLARARELTGRPAIDAALWSASGTARVFEAPAHAVCLLPVEDWPLWGFARERRLRRTPRPPSPDTIKQVVGLVEDEGPSTIRELEAGSDRSAGWDWSETKRAAEFLVWTGSLVCCERRGALRVYDLPGRRIPGDLLVREVEEPDALAALVDRAARVCGIATERDLAEYFRLRVEDVRKVIPGAGLVQATVPGWEDTAWIHPAALDRDGTEVPPTFVAPFDNLVWDRDRTRRVFGFDYAFEAYKPPAKRRYGYYVMPLVAGDEIVARADLAREGKRLVARKVHFEDSTAPDLDLVTEAGRRLAGQLSGLEFHIEEVVSP